MKFRRKARESVDINLAPLIDVVFILLLFFVVTTTFTRPTQLKVDLPEAASGTPPQETCAEAAGSAGWRRWQLRGQRPVSCSTATWRA